MKYCAFLWNNLKGQRIKFVSALILSVFSAAMVIITPYLSKILIDDCIRGEMKQWFLPLVLAMGGVALLQNIIRVVRMVFLEHASQQMLMSIRSTIYDKVQNQDMDFFDDISSGDIITRTTGDLEYLRHFIAWVTYNTIETIVMFTVSVIMLFFINPTLTWLLLAVMPFLLITSVVYSKKVRPQYRGIRQQLAKLNSAAQENIDGNRVVKAFVREEHEIEKFAEKSKEFKDFNLNATYMWQKIVPLMNFFSESLSVITLIAGGILVIRDHITLGDLTLFTSLTWALAMPMKNISVLLNNLQHFLPAVEKVFEICEYPQKIKDAEDAISEDKRLSGKIEFKNVSFGYGKNQILDDVSFKIEPGETVVIMGPTGSGKTTLINLILRFYDVTSGAILLDDVDIRKRTLSNVRKTTAVATQDVFLFSDTIDGNIAFSDTSMPEQRVKNCAKLACADDFIERTTEGYDTIIGERGVGLSGGQRQRIALARALAAEPSVLILDDTTSAVDADTERQIQKSLENLPFSATKIIVAQRISATKCADKIFILENKKLVCGTHEELVKTNEYYHNICEIQAML